MNFAKFDFFTNINIWIFAPKQQILRNWFSQPNVDETFFSNFSNTVNFLLHDVYLVTNMCHVLLTWLLQNYLLTPITVFENHLKMSHPEKIAVHIISKVILNLCTNIQFWKIRYFGAEIQISKSKQGRPPRNSEKGAVRCCRRAMRWDNPALQRRAKGYYLCNGFGYFLDLVYTK